ncbi:MAG: ABC transporter ATP-binding protein [Candidatus Dormibacteraeota bacterium]|nr:ABC transporter ATP-binding protein [Candidatus Dormibacteraeota bacterium]MBO0744170.1 ABC transporter ATP-binding protein [Candidatus Dormibacteraeota bacterium]
MTTDHPTPAPGADRASEPLVVETHGLTKRFGHIVAVDNLDMRIHRGEVYGFLGANGAGKTTTLRMLTGLIRATSGSAIVAGHPPGTPAGLAKIGSLIEGPAFYSYLSGYDNLRVVAEYAGLKRSHIEDALGIVEMLPRAHDKYKTYSMGMKQRIAMAAALLKSPELLILDEPTNGLDPQGIVAMRKLIVDLGHEGRTVLVSSHLLDEVEQMCTRIGVIKTGRLIAEGTMAELRSGPSMLEVRAEPHDKASDLLRRMVGPDSVQENDGMFRVRAEPDEAAQLNRSLVEEGLEVSHLAVAQRSLEDVFLELTGTEVGS